MNSGESVLLLYTTQMPLFGNVRYLEKMLLMFWFFDEKHLLPTTTVRRLSSQATQG